MKKVLLFLFALCAFSSMAVAQGGVAFADLDEGKYYYMKSGRQYVANAAWFRGYVEMKEDGTNLTLKGIEHLHNAWNGDETHSGPYTAAFDEGTAGKAAMWGVIKYTDINGGNYAIIYNASNGKCFKSTETFSSDLATMTLVEEVGYYRFDNFTGDYKENNSYCIRNVSTRNADAKMSLAPGQTYSSNKCVNAYTGSNTDGGVPIIFVEVPAANANNTFDPNLKKVVELRDIYGNAKKAETLMTELNYSGTEFDALKSALTTFRSAPTVANAEALQTAYSTMVPLHCGNDFSYEIYHYKYGTATGRGMMAYDNSRTYQKPATVGVTYTGYNGYSNPDAENVSTQWGIYKDKDESYYIYNESYAARLLGAGAPSDWSETPVRLALAPNSNQANTFAITQASSTGNALGISLGYLHQNGGGDIRLQGNLTDDGAKLMIRIVGKANQNAQNIVKAMLRLEGKGYVGGPITDDVLTGEQRTAENANAILAANYEILSVSPTKHYRIISNLRDKAISTQACNAGTDGILIASGTDENNVQTKSYTTDVISSLCQFVSAGDGLYNVRMDNAGLFLGDFNSGTCNLQQTENHSVISLKEQSSLPSHIWTLHVGTDADADTYLNAWNGTNDEKLGTYQLLGSNSNSIDNGNKWKIQLVESVPVTLSAAGWSTKCFPFAVNIPEGIKAYYVTSIQGGEVYVKELEGVIPARTAVLLNGRANLSRDFVITDDVDPLSDNNLLIGTTLRRKGYGNGDVYGLKVKAEDNTAAFVAANTTDGAVPANKAVLDGSKVREANPSQPAAALSLNFGEATGITEADTITAEGNEAIYDINGRRVSTLRHGVVYIKANGQKFILK